MNLLIATPAFGGNVKSRTAESLFKLAQALAREGHQAEFVTAQLAEIARARNYFASAFLGHAGFSHLLFVDADMAFHPDCVLRLLRADKPFIGHVYTKRTLVLERLIANARALRDNRAVIARSYDYNATYRSDPGEAVRIDKGLMRLSGIGMGLCLLHRSVFETLIASGAAVKHAEAEAQAFRPSLRGDLWGFFDNIMLDGAYLSEDFSFCRRWVEECRGEIWGMVTDYIEHIGDMSYGAPFLFSLDG